MSYLDKKFGKRQKKYRRNYEIENSLYTKLEELSDIYDASVADLINSSLEYLIETEKIALYEKDPHEIVVTHTILIKENNLAGLESLKAKYGVILIQV